MKYEKERLTISGLGMAIVCIAAVLLSASSILSTYRMQKMTSQIYEHPYTVSNEARATRSRLLDMRFFILTMFTQPDQDMSSVQEILNQRYSMQYESIETITSQYLGPKKDSERLMAAMRDLEETQNEAVLILLPLSESDTSLYIEEHL